MAEVVVEVLIGSIAAVVVGIWFLLRQSRKARLARRIDSVRNSHFFDADWYLAYYADIAEARIDPAVHYTTVGGFEGRDPGPEFNSSRYLKTNRDVAESGCNPLVHYLERALAEGRTPGSIVSAPSKARAARRRRPTYLTLKPIPDQFIVLDIETDGLQCARDEVTGISAIKAVRQGDNNFTYHLLSIPKKRISTRIKHLTGVYRKRRLGALGAPIEEVFPLLIDFCKDLPIVAFNVDFNQKVLDAACDRYDLIPPSGEWTCALRFSRAAWPGRQDDRLSTLCADAGIRLDDECRASINCERAMRLYIAVIGYMFGMNNSPPSFVASTR